MQIRILETGIVETQDFDAVATAGNCTAAMLGGLDWAFAQKFGPNVVQAVKREAKGYLPIGRAVVVPTGMDAPHLFVYAPTMERPMDVRGTKNAFRAALAACMAARDAGARSLALPLFCTGYGKMAPDVARRQIEDACMAYRAIEYTKRRDGFSVFPVTQRPSWLIGQKGT